MEVISLWELINCRAQLTTFPKMQFWPFSTFHELYLNSALMNYPCLFCTSDILGHRLALPTWSRALVHALSHWYLFSDPRRCEMNRKLRALRRVSESGAPHIVTWIKQTWIKRQCTVFNLSLNWYLCQGPSTMLCSLSVEVAGFYFYIIL